MAKPREVVPVIELEAFHAAERRVLDLLPEAAWKVTFQQAMANAYLLGVRDCVDALEVRRA